jgi:hypothetical protein
MKNDPLSAVRHLEMTKQRQGKAREANSTISFVHTPNPTSYKLSCINSFKEGRSAITKEAIRMVNITCTSNLTTFGELMIPSFSIMVGSSPKK